MGRKMNINKRYKAPVPKNVPSVGMAGAAVKQELIPKRQFGSVASGDYVEFDESTGFIRFYGNAMFWDDFTTDLTGVRLESASARITANPTDATIDFQSNADASDFLYGNGQVKHRTYPESDIHPHIHWIQNQNTVPAWRFDYRFLRNGLAIPSWTSITTTTESFTYSSGSILQISEFDEGITLPANCYSCIMQFKLFRIGASDSYTGDAQLVEFDFHYKSDTLGSYGEYSKYKTS